MEDRVLGPSRGRPKHRQLAVLSFAALLALALTLWFAVGAGAVGEESGFEDDDGNLVLDNSADFDLDWNSFAPTTWTGTAPTRTSSGSFMGWDFTGLEDWAASTQDSAFGGGTKQDDDCASVGTGKAPNKDDLERVYFSTNTVDGHVYLNLAWVRIPQNTTSPSAHVAFEFNQGETPCPPGSDDLVRRTAGDMLILYDFEGGTTDTPTIRLSRWTTDPLDTCEVAKNSPPCWGPAATLGAGVAEARVNTFGSVADGIAPTPENLGTNEFGEAGIDLTDADVFPADACVAFGNAFAVSRSSGNSGTAQMKDLVGPGEVDIRNCGQVIIRKVTDPSPDPTDTTFTYTTTGGLDPDTFGLKDGEAQDYGAEVQAGSYSVTEDDPSPNFALTDIDCSASETGNGTTFTPDPPDPATRTVSFNLAAEDIVDCTFTNTLQRGAIMIEKRSTKGDNPLVSTDGAVFSYDDGTTVPVPEVTDNGAGDEDPTIGKVCVSGLLPGDYTVNETSHPSGYGGASETDLTATAATGTNCTDNQPTGTGVVTFTNPPLSDIQVRFRDGGSGETSLAQPISCSNTTGDTNTDPTTGWDDTKTVLGVEAPTTIQCTIEIDP